MAKFEVGKIYTLPCLNNKFKIIDRNDKSMKIHCRNGVIINRKIKRWNEGFDNEMEYFYVSWRDELAIKASDRID